MLQGNDSLIQKINESGAKYVQENITHAPMYLCVCVTIFNILELIIGVFGNAIEGSNMIFHSLTFARSRGKC